MSLLPPLGLAMASLPGTTAPILPTSPRGEAPSGPATPAASGRLAGPDMVNRADQVTPSRIMLEVRRAVAADLLAQANAAQDGDAPRTPAEGAEASAAMTEDTARSAPQADGTSPVSGQTERPALQQHAPAPPVTATLAALASPDAAARYVAARQALPI